MIKALYIGFVFALESKKLFYAEAQSTLFLNFKYFPVSIAERFIYFIISSILFTRFCNGDVLLIKNIISSKQNRDI